MSQISILNSKAMLALEEQDCMRAQTLFFENAKKNPCHETYNNLGYFLITEGLECKNGQVRNAHILGFKYLLKASKFHETALNLCAIAAAIHYSYKGKYKNYLGISTYQNAYEALNQAVKIEYSDRTEYNRLRFLYLCDTENIAVLEGLEKLIKTFRNEDSVFFYLYVLCIHLRLDECLSNMDKYNEFLDDVDLLILYYLCGRYKEGAKLFSAINHNFLLDEFESAIMIECLIKAEMFDQAHFFANERIEFEQTMEKSYRGRDSWIYLVFENLTQSTEYRRNFISKYRRIPAFIDRCCYFGCSKHGNPDMSFCEIKN